MLVDVDGQSKWRWVHADVDNALKHSSIQTHYAVGEENESKSTSTGTSSGSEFERDSKRQKMRMPPSRRVSPSPKSSVKKSLTPAPVRVYDGLYKNYLACDRKKR